MKHGKHEERVKDNEDTLHFLNINFLRHKLPFIVSQCIMHMYSRNGFLTLRTILIGEHVSVMSLLSIWNIRLMKDFVFLNLVFKVILGFNSIMPVRKSDRGVLLIWTNGDYHFYSHTSHSTSHSWKTIWELTSVQTGRKDLNFSECQLSLPCISIKNKLLFYAS